MTAERPLATSARGERKLVTVAFIDLTGYTALAASLDPEEVYRSLRPGLQALQRIVEGFGGTVPQVLGDGFMAVFGVPSAHEDDDERAVRAALAVRDHVAELNAGREGIRFPDVHAGVNAGEVMVAPSDELAGFAVIGDTVNTASRLADLAPGGTILVDGSTADRTAHAFRYGPVRVLRAKGKAEGVAACEALGVRPRSEARRGSRSVFVDRLESLERIRRELNEASRTSRSRVLVVAGEPGTGKSRLAAELRRRRAGRVVMGRCPAFGERLPLHALAEAIGSALGLAAGASAASVDLAGRRLAGALPRGERAGFGRSLRLLLGTERQPTGQARESVHDAARAARLAIELLANGRPLVVVVDDLQWADADLVRLLRDVHREPWLAPVLVLALSRPGPGLRGLPQLELPLLERDDMRSIARHVLGGEVPQDAMDQTLERADGNPLFLEETLGMLVETGALGRRKGAWEVKDPELLRGVPSTIRRLIAARLDVLPPAEKAALQDAAVAGDVAWDRLLEHLDDRPDVAPALASLERRGLLVRREPSVFPGAVELEVKHLLIREVAYESVPRRDRAAKHLEIARWLQREATVLPEEPVAWVAHHLERAWELGRSRSGPGPSDETARLAVGALQRWADRTFSYQARLAESIYGRALGVARAAGDAIAAPVVADLLAARAECRVEMGRHREALEDATEAGAIADLIGDGKRRARALLCLGRTESDLGRISKARMLAEHSRRLFHAEGDVRGEAWALHRRSETWNAIDPVRELNDLQASYALFARARDRWGRAIVAQDLAYLLSPSGGSDFRTWYGRAERLAGDHADLRSQAALARTVGYASFYAGEYRRAIAEMAEAEPLAARSGDRYAQADALLIRSMCEAAVGSPGVAASLAEQLLRLARELGSGRLQALGHLASSRAAVRSGDPAAASRALATARRMIEARRRAVTMVDLHVMDGWIRLDRGSFEGIAEVARRAEVAARRVGWSRWEPMGWLFRGRAALGHGRWETAAVYLERAGRLARSTGATGTARLALLLHHQGRLASGRGRRLRGSGGVPADDPETFAIALENEALEALRSGALDRARAGFEGAAAAWEPFGATVWHARALRLSSEAARAAGERRDATDLRRRSDRVFDRLRTPARDRARIARAAEIVVG